MNFPPPHFMTFFQLTLFCGTLVGIPCGIVIAFMSNTWELVVIGVTALLTGGPCGMSVAFYYLYTGRNLDLLPWSDLPDWVEENAASSSRSSLGRRIKNVLTMDSDSLEQNKWWKLIVGIGGAILLAGSLFKVYDRVTTREDKAANHSPEFGQNSNQPFDAPVEIRSASGAKLQAFKSLVAWYKSAPQGSVSTAQLRDHWDRVETAQQKFAKIPFDPEANSAEAKAIVELYLQEIYGNYSGSMPDKLYGEYITPIWQNIPKVIKDEIRIPAYVRRMWAEGR